MGTGEADLDAPTVLTAAEARLVPVRRRAQRGDHGVIGHPYSQILNQPLQVVLGLLRLGGL